MVEPGSTCAVFGLGAVGLAAVMGCKAAGAKRIFAVDINPEKFEKAKVFGATDCVNPNDQDKPISQVLAEMTDGGVDFSLECVGNVGVMRSALESSVKGWGVSVLVGWTDLYDVAVRPIQLIAGRTWKGSLFGDFLELVESKEEKKQEQEEPWTNTEGVQLQQPEEADIKVTMTPFALKSEEDEEKPQSSQLHQSQNEENGGRPEPARNSSPDEYLHLASEDNTEDSSETEDSEDDWMETREPQSGLNIRTNKQPLRHMRCKTDKKLHADFLELVVSKEEVPPEQQQWSPLADQEDPEPLHIKEEQEEPWTNMEGEQLQQLKEADIKVTLTPFAVKSEEDEEKHQSSQLHQSQNEENRAAGGRQEPSRISGPDEYLQPGSEDNTEDSSETEDSEDDWMETSERLSGLNIRTNKHTLRDMRCKPVKKPFSCSECATRFRQKSALTKHMMTHKGERPMNCSE